MRKKKGHYSISAVAEMFSVHQQTIRLYEKEGLISPKRSGGNTRMFSEKDVERLEEIIYLTHKMGINLAGVEMILRLKKQIGRLQKNMNSLFEKTKVQMESESESCRREIKTARVRLLELRDETPQNEIKRDLKTPLDVDSWEVEYDEDK